ncbi:MAG TPA: DMT family transporter [Mycobacteriales bacterium]|nr:DMT family transporter [Mycobacteriales bacterium]
MTGTREPPVPVAPGVLAAPPRGDVLLLIVGVSAVSTSGPLIAATAAPALAIAFWRNALATGVLLPVAAWRHRRELRGLHRRERYLALLAGALLAAHFATWVPSVTLTSVGSSTALVATQPVWAALLARRAGARISRGAWVGIWLAVAGAAVLTGADLSLSGRAVAGDLLALVGGAFAAAYVTAGGAVRRSVSTTAYTTICYGVTALLLLVVCLIGRQQLVGYDGRTWLKLAALTGGAQLLGHSVFNRVLRTTSPTVVSLTILVEVPGATLIAALVLHQPVRLAQLPGAVLLLAGVGAVIRAGARAVPAE